MKCMIARGEGAARCEDASPDPGIYEHEASNVVVLRTPRKLTLRESEEPELNLCPFQTWILNLNVAPTSK